MSRRNRSSLDLRAIPGAKRLSLNWRRDCFPGELAEGAMNDTLLVLIKSDGRNGRLVAYVHGPTGVYWISWVNGKYVPGRLFHG